VLTAMGGSLWADSNSFSIAAAGDPNWVAPTNRQNTMTLSIVVKDTQGAEQTSGEVAVSLSNGEICGVGEAPLVFPPTGRSIWDVTAAFNNEASNTRLDFKFYDAAADKMWMLAVRQAQTLGAGDFPTIAVGQPINLEADKSYGNAANPLVLQMTPTTVELSIELQAGWKWISVNVLRDDMSVSELLDAGFSEGDMIKGSGSYSQFYGGWGWFGTLSTLDITQAYAVKCSAPKTLKVTGTPVALPSNFPIQAGWNWVGMAHPSPTGLDKFHFGEVEANDMIKSQSAFSTYYAGWGWFGTVTELQPGVGYKLQAANAGTLVYQA